MKTLAFTLKTSLKTVVILLLFSVTCFGEENKCEKLELKHAWNPVEVFGGYNINGLRGFRNLKDYQRCANCGIYKLKVLIERYKYWEDSDEKDHSLSWFNISDIPFSDIDK